MTHGTSDIRPELCAVLDLRRVSAPPGLRHWASVHVQSVLITETPAAVHGAPGSAPERIFKGQLGFWFFHHQQPSRQARAGEAGFPAVRAGAVLSTDEEYIKGLGQ